jgi:hypothetical protein
MLRLRSQSRTLLILLCIGIVMMRVGGAHLHYCFDGSEPPVSLHIDGHAGSHHMSNGVSSSNHEDIDISVGVDALVKKVPTLLDLLGLIAALAIFLHLLPRVKTVVPSFDLVLPFSTRRAYLRPPLRGPPL